MSRDARPVCRRIQQIKLRTPIATTYCFNPCTAAAAPRAITCLCRDATPPPAVHAPRPSLSLLHSLPAAAAAVSTTIVEREVSRDDVTLSTTTPLCGRCGTATTQLHPGRVVNHQWELLHRNRSSE